MQPVGGIGCVEHRGTEGIGGIVAPTGMAN